MQYMSIKSIARIIHPTRLLFAREVCSQLFVGGLSYDTNEPVLKDAFKHHGEIIEVKVICDRTSGYSKGYGFVRYASESLASAALEKMDGQLLDGKRIRVQYAVEGFQVDSQQKV